MLKIDKIRHFVFDWNGTLLDDAWLCVDIANIMLAKRNHEPITADFYSRHFDMPVELFYEKTSFDLEKESYSDLAHEFMEIYEQRKIECKLREGARDFIELLRKRGIILHVLSSYFHKYLEHTLDKYGIGYYFKNVSGNANVKAGSKVENARRLAARTAHISTHECLMLGDTTHDKDAALAMNSSCCLIHSGHNDIERLNNTSSPVVQSYSELIVAFS